MNDIQTFYTTTPIRLNDIGGWTDTWYAKTGNVLNLAAAPGVMVKMNLFPNPNREKKRVKVHARNYGETFVTDPDNPDYNVHPLLQASLAAANVPRDIQLEIELKSSVPAGISVGTSASVCVALLGALLHVTSAELSLRSIAAMAHRVETEILGWQSGIQDQICAALGGICYIHMPDYPDAEVEKLQIPQEIHKELNARLALVYLGKSHSSSHLHEQVIAELERGGPQLQQIKKMAALPKIAKEYLLSGDLEGYGEVMIRNNEYQRSLHPELIAAEADAVIEIARKYHAQGWKVNGAGGQGGSITVLGSVAAADRGGMQREIIALGSGIKTIPVSLSEIGLSTHSK